MSDSANTEEDVCSRCREFGPGRTRWMFHNNSLPAQEFYCFRCQRIMRIYAWIGFSLLFALVGGLSVTVFLLTR